MASVIGVTGTPGTGKKSVAPLLARKLRIACVGLGAATPGSGEEIEVDTFGLRRQIGRHPPGRVVAYGHLLPYILPSRLAAKVLVLRCEPRVLKNRLWRRGYSESKIKDNVEAELIGLIASDAFSTFGPAKTVELDTTDSPPEQTVNAAARTVLGRKSPTPRIDWMVGYGSARGLRSLLSA